MHIGLIIYGHLDILSGGYLYNRQLVNYWRQSGHQVTIFTLPWRNYWRHLGDNFARRWSRELIEAPVDVFVQDELNHPSLLRTNWQIKRRRPVPLVSLVHLLRSSEPHSPLSAPLYRTIERVYLQQMDGLIANSHDTARAVAILAGQDHPHVIAYPGRDHWFIPLSDDDIQLRAFDPGPLRLLYVGNYIQRKGLHVLLEALAEIDCRRWRLTAIGRRDLDPAFTRRLENLVETLELKEQVQLHGPVPFDEMPPFFHSHQLFVMPSLYEPFGIVYLEAMGAGLPVIATTAGAGGELVTPGQNGFLVPPGNKDQIVRWITTLLHERDRLAEMGIQAKIRYENHPTWRETGEKITGFLTHLVRSGG